MKSIIKVPHKNCMGNLIWMPPYFYPEHELEEGIEHLREKNYWVSTFLKEDGLTFKSNIEKDENSIVFDFEIAFPWMDIKHCPVDEEMNFKRDILSTNIVILPLSRFEIFENIHTSNFSIFGIGELNIDILELTTSSEVLYNSSDTKTIRDEINRITKIDRSVFKERPLIVIRDQITIEQYIQLKHFEDNELIRRFAETTEEIFDIIRFEYCNYTVPELLPARAGLYNDRYSAALLYFPEYQKGIFQAREVELKTFIKGIGLRIDYIDTIQYHRLFTLEINETGKITKHALRLNSLIQESDNETSKFMQIMTLFEFIGDPYNYLPFQKVKGKIISIIAKTKTEYHELSKRFEELTAGLKDSTGTRKIGIRTSIVHLGRRLEEIVKEPQKRKKLFVELENYVSINIQFMIENCDIEWNQFDNLRVEKMRQLK